MGALQTGSISPKWVRLLQLGAFILAFAVSSALPAQKPSPKPTNDDCLACHSDSTMVKDVNGKKVSLYVNPGAFKNSIHGGIFTCVDCHSDIKTSPHESTPAKVSCAQCHADQQAAYDRSYHAKAIKAGDGQPCSHYADTANLPAAEHFPERTRPV